MLAFYREIRDKVKVEWGPEVMSYGMREFAISDLNGYLLGFWEPEPEANVSQVRDEE